MDAVETPWYSFVYKVFVKAHIGLHDHLRTRQVWTQWISTQFPSKGDQITETPDMQHEDSPWRSHLECVSRQCAASIEHHSTRAPGLFETERDQMRHGQVSQDSVRGPCS